MDSMRFGQKVKIALSGEEGVITGYSRHMRTNADQHFVEYKDENGHFSQDWFFADQLTALEA